jgi:hypothetical protein
MDGTRQLGLPGIDMGRARRNAGQDSLERHPWLTRARQTAAEICLVKGTVSSDDVQNVLPLPAGVHHNAWGAVFRAPWFIRTGQFVQSQRPEAHARWIQVWRLGEYP